MNLMGSIFKSVEFFTHSNAATLYRIIDQQAHFRVCKGA